MKILENGVFREMTENDKFYIFIKSVRQKLEEQSESDDSEEG